MVRDEAARLADELARVERETEERAEREAEELEEYLLKQNGLRRALAAAESLVREAAGWRLVSRRCGSDSSHYFWLFFGGESEADWEERIGLRISDHYAPNGSGWNELTQDRHPEPDINIVIRRGAGGEYTFDLTPLVETISR